MIQASATVHQGMDVYSADGEKLGCISAVWPNVPVAPSGEPLDPSDPPHRAVDTGYFQVDGPGVVGLGSGHWYIPLREVGNVEPERVSLACSGADCEERYAQRPNFVDLDVT
jgi:hypothetical protein